MASRPPFPGMNPFWEDERFLPEVHHWLLVSLARMLNSQITPKYRAVLIVNQPVATGVAERSLEIREVSTGRVVTAVELLSPANKRKGEGRQQYLAKRQRILNSTVHLVEIDLLRAGEPMPSAGGRKADYQILVSQVNARPTAERYPFDLQEAIPRFLLPLDEGEQEPVIDLGELLQQVCDETALDLAINYREQPAPSLSESDFTWLKSIVE